MMKSLQLCTALFEGFVRLRSFSPTVGIPISILSPFRESIAVNKLAKRGLKILAQTQQERGFMECELQPCTMGN